MMMTLNPFEKKFITTVLTAVKKNKQPAHTPGGPGRLRSWSGPVETDFQGRLRFSYANRPARVAAVRATEDSCPTMAVGCVGAICARLSRRRAAQVRSCARKKSAIDPADYGRSRGIW
jgi:hypothetical protein